MRSTGTLMCIGSGAAFGAMAVFGKLLKELFGKTVLTGPKAGGNVTSGTKVTTISGGIATLLTWYLQKKGYDVIVEPELIAAFTVIIAQWFHRKGGDEQGSHCNCMIRWDA